LRLEWGEQEANRIGVLLTINFGRHHFEPVSDLKIWFGLKSGYLELKPVGGKLPFKTRWPQTPLTVETRTESEPLNEAKNSFTQRLGDDWRALADLLEIPGHTQRYFIQGFEARAIWAWLEERKKLACLPNILHRIVRPDLAEDLSIQWEAGRNSNHNQYCKAPGLVRTQGDDENAQWIFESSEGREYLLGSLIEKEISKFEIEEKSCGIQSHFKVDQIDIHEMEIASIPVSGNKGFFIKLFTKRKIISDINKSVKNRISRNV